MTDPAPKRYICSGCGTDVSEYITAAVITLQCPHCFQVISLRKKVVSTLTKPEPRRQRPV